MKSLQISQFFNFTTLKDSAKTVLLIVLVQVLLQSCNAIKYPTNILAIDGQGRVLDPAGAKIKYAEQEYRSKDQLSTIRQQLEDGIQSDNVDTILVYIHGGLTGLKGGIKENVGIVDAISKESPKTYPIFINWQAGLLPSYGQHLFRIRQGEVHTFFGPTLSSPIVFSYDFLRAVVRHPSNMYYQLVNDFNSAGVVNDRRRNAMLRYENMARDPNIGMQMRFGKDKRPFINRLGRGTWYVLLSPFRYTASIFFVDFLGTNSWANMKRKTNIMYRPQSEFDFRQRQALVVTSNPSKPTGIAYQLFEMIAEVRNKYPDVVINLIGHSMGTIILNEAFATLEELEVDNVIYMGAACSIADFESSIIPAMKRNTNMKFYHLMLHPSAESKEQFGGITHAGSLLEWIDNYFEPVSNYEERVFGKFENTMVAGHVIPESIRTRVVLKTFDFVKDGTAPYKHGQFNDVDNVGYRFWKPVFWKL